MELWRDSTVVLTGASGGIGNALALAISRRGGSLILCGRNSTRLRALSDALGPSIVDVVIGDLTDPSIRQQLLDALPDQPQRLILINNAGAGQFGAFEAQDPGALDRLVAINLLVPMLLCRALMPALRQSGQARIVNVGSAFGAIGFPGFTAYSAAKFGLRGFSQALARELAGSGIGVQHIAPRATRTGFNSSEVDELNVALGHAVDDPEWVAEQICRAVTRGTDEQFLGWPERLFVRINGLWPRLLGHALRRKLPLLRSHFNPGLKSTLARAYRPEAKLEDSS